MPKSKSAKPTPDIYDEGERRNWARHIIDDDPIRADYLLDLLLHTDSSTPNGAAARDDVVRYVYGYTSECQEVLRQRIESAK